MTSHSMRRLDDNDGRSDDPEPRPIPVMDGVDDVAPSTPIWSDKKTNENVE